VNYQRQEREAREAILKARPDFEVQDANVLFRANCPNIDLVVFGKTKAVYVQVKSSETPATKDGVVVDGSPWSRAQLYDGAPIFNKHTGPRDFEAVLVVIVDHQKSGEVNFYIVPPRVLADLLIPRGRAWAETPKKDGTARSLNFRKELQREILAPWRDAWHLLDSMPPGA
jgi:hypothetical protein